MTETLTHDDWIDQVRTLRHLVETARSPVEAREVIRRIVAINRRYRIQTGIGIPQSPIEQARDLDPTYVTRPHLEYLSDRIARAVRDVERGQNRRIATSMPPRSGKSTLTSLYAPLWMLRRHPEWEFVMTSHDGSLVTDWARQLREIIEDRVDLGIMLQPDGGAGGKWRTIERGGMYSASVGVGRDLTGRGARVMIIDDPVSDWVAAHSPRLRENLWNWWLSVAQTRLESPFLVLTTMCMTGDTPVLRPDGSETPLRVIRPGDVIATYEDGRLTTSTVRNWANQGPDKVYRVRTSSGIEVRANARHPFLTVDENGVESWVRLESLKVGMKVLRIMAPTEESFAQKMNAKRLPSARGCVCPTMGERVGQQVSAPLPIAPSIAVLYASEGGTGSSLLTTINCSKNREDGVRSAVAPSMRLSDRSTGQMSSALTMTTSPDRYEACSATTATSSLGVGVLRTSSALPLFTWTTDPEHIVEIADAGVEDVFDIQVERTENFIANGLVSHNTRWHEDDFVGRLFSPEHEGAPKDWERIVIPAIAEDNDQINRAKGEPLLSPLMDEDRDQSLLRWEQTRSNVGEYTWAGLYQQRPAPAKGAIFDAGWWRFWTWDPEKVLIDGKVIHLDPASLVGGEWVDSWDLAFDSDGDYVVGQRWVKFHANRFLIAQKRGRWGFTDSIKQMEAWAGAEDPVRNPYGSNVHQRLVEKKANGAAAINVLHDKIPGLKAVNPTRSKEVRARAVTPEIESGNVYLPHPSDPGNEWVNELLSELRNFPHEAHDDQVDTLTQVLDFFRPVAAGGITNPASQRNSLRYQRPRSLTETARSDLSRRR